MTNTVGVGTVVLTEVVRDAISLADLERMVSHRRAGAVVSFVGTVRDHDHERSVIDLEYEAHPDANWSVQAETVTDSSPIRRSRSIGGIGTYGSP